MIDEDFVLVKVGDKDSITQFFKVYDKEGRFRGIVFGEEREDKAKEKWYRAFARFREKGRKSKDVFIWEER